MPQVYYFTPYSPHGLGVAYNQHCALVPHEDDWICLMDADVMFFSHQRLGEQIEEAITQNPKYDVFTCVTNRIHPTGLLPQQLPGDIYKEYDLVELHKTAKKQAEEFRGQVVPLTGFFAGYFMLFTKKLWLEIPFPVVGSEGGRILGIDTAWSRTVHNAGKKVGLLKGLMAAHYYRLDTGERSTEHLGDKERFARRQNVTVWSAPSAHRQPPASHRISG